MLSESEDGAAEMVREPGTESVRGGVSARGISSVSLPISSARSVIARLDEPSRSWRPRVRYAARAIMTMKPMTEGCQVHGSTGFKKGNLLKTAMIFMTSTMPIEGLKGNMMNDGVKKMLIQRRDHPA